MTRRVGCTVRAALAVTFLAGAWSCRAGAQDAPPWPTLPDGRVVLEIAGHRLAFPPDTRRGEVQIDTVPGRFERRDLAEFVRDPAGARAAFEGAHSVWVWITNAHNAPGRLLGRYDRLALPDTRTFGIGLYPGTATACAAPPWTTDDFPRRLCERFDRLARNPPALDEYGFIVDRPDFARGLGSTFYVFPAAERLSAVGEPIFFRCQDVLRFCRNAVGHLADGYVLQPGVRLLYQFSAHHYPEATWRDVDARFRAVADNILLTDRSEVRP